MPAPSDTDGELLKCFAATRSEAAFETVLRRHDALVLRICTQVLQNPHEAEDAAQAVFLTLAHKAGSLSRYPSVAGWLYRVAWYVARRARTSLAQRAKREKEKAQMHPPAESSTSPATELLSEELQKLPDKYLLPLVLHHQEGLSEENTANVLGLNRGTVSARISRGRELLRARLARRGIHTSVSALGALLGISAQGMSAELVAATVKAASLSVGGKLAGAGVSAQAAQLMESALRMLLLQKMKSAAIALALLLVLSSTGWWAWRVQAKPGPGVGPEVAETKETKPRPRAEHVRLLGAAPFQGVTSLNGLAFSPGVKYVAAAGRGAVVIWDLATQREVVRRTSENFFMHLHFLSDSQLLLGDDARGAIVQWDFLALKDIRTFQPKPGKNSRDNPVHVRWFTVSPDGKTLLAAHGVNESQGLIAWDIGTGELTAEMPDVLRQEKGVHFIVRHAAFSPDGKRVALMDEAIGGDPTIGNLQRPELISIWDWQTRKQLCQWQPQMRQKVGSFNEIEWLPDGRRLLLTQCWEDRRQCAVMLSADDGAFVQAYPGSGQLAPDKNSLISLNEHSVVQYRLKADGTQVSGEAAVEVGPIQYPWRARVSSDGRWFACIANRQALVLIDRQSKALLAPVECGHTQVPDCGAYTADGRFISHDGRSRVYDETGALLLTFSPGHASASNCAGLPDGRVMLYPGAGKKAEAWDTITGKRLGSLAAHEHAIEALFVSEHGGYALSIAQKQGTIQIHDLKTGRVTARLSAPVLDGPFAPGPVAAFKAVVWNAAGDRMYVADESVAYLTPEAVHSLNKNRGPIGFTGVLDPRDGKLLYHFRDAENKIIERASELQLCPTHDLVYLAGASTMLAPAVDVATALPSPHHASCGLYQASTGKFVRTLASPGPDARFSPDGQLLVGTENTVSVDTGKVLAPLCPPHVRIVSHSSINGKQYWQDSQGKEYDALPAHRPRALSPSTTLLAWINLEDSTIHLVDTRTGQEIWVQNYYQPELAGHAIRQLQWSPAETQLILWPSGHPALMQVDLWTGPLLPAKTQGDASSGLSAKDSGQQQQAIQALIGQGAPALGILERVLTSSKDVRALRAAIIAVEALARTAATQSAAEKVLLDLEKNGPVLQALFARDARARLAAGARAVALRWQHQKMDTLAWPAPAGPPAATPTTPPNAAGDF